MIADSSPLCRFKSEEDAVKMANDTPHPSPPRGRGRVGEGAASRDIGRIWRVAEALEYRIIGINEGIISTEMAALDG